MWEQVEWGQVIVAAIVVGGSLVTGRWAWNKLPKKDIGSTALASVQSAKESIELARIINDERLEQLEARVQRLEVLVEQKEEKIRLLEAEIKRLLQWIQALIEQVQSLGQTPVMLDEIVFRHPEGD